MVWHSKEKSNSHNDFLFMLSFCVFFNIRLADDTQLLQRYKLFFEYHAVTGKNLHTLQK